MMKSYLFSQLAKQHARSDFATFEAMIPHSWLVWEPGPWRPPAQSQATVRAQPSTAKTAGGEALAMLLVLPPGKSELTLGRESDNTLVVNDGTLSRTHLVFTQEAGAWYVRDGGSSNGSILNGKKLEQVRAEPLKDGNQLQAGSVYFTFYGPRGLFFRLKGMG